MGERLMGDNRVNRGGSWNSNAQNCRSANRNRNNPSNRNNNLGFRLVPLFSTRKCLNIGAYACQYRLQFASRPLPRTIAMTAIVKYENGCRATFNRGSAPWPFFLIVNTHYLIKNKGG